MAFPTSPTNGQTSSVNNILYTYASATRSWTRVLAGANVITANSLILSTGLQNTAIGNVTPSTALFTTVGSSGNTTVSALTVNANATVGTTLGVTGNISGSGVTLTGSLTARGPGKFDGGLQSTPIGNVAPSTALFTTVGSSGNTTVSALSVNASATVGTTLGVTGNITGGNVNTAGVVRATGDVFGKEIWSTQSSGDEGGQINFAIPVTNTSLTGQVTVDVFQNRLRFFQGDNARGAYIDLTQANIGVGTNLLAGGSGGTPGGANTYVQFNDGGLFGGNVNFTYDKGLNIVSAGAFAGTTNGTGQNFKVGDDAWIGDINLSNTIGIKGQQDATQGYIVFGNTNTQTLGRSGAGALTYQGGFTAQGGLQNTPIGNTTPSTALFTTVGTSGNTTVSALTVNATATIGTTLGVTGNVNIGNVAGVTWANAGGVRAWTYYNNSTTSLDTVFL